MNIRSNKLEMMGIWLVLGITTLITVLLAAATAFINPWPTDSYVFYLPAARELLRLDYISQIHDIPTLRSIGPIVMHGKESLILGIALMQKILSDHQTIYPNVLLLILSLQVSSILIYRIAGRLFGAGTGMIIFILFATCFWPYLYVLQGAHQPWVLMFFLLTVFFLQKANDHPLFYLFTGMAFGLMLFASPTAVTYIPYYLLVFFIPKSGPSSDFKITMNVGLKNGLLFLAGCLPAILVFLLPDPIKSLKMFIEFLSYSQHANHFDYHHGYLKQHLSPPYSLHLPRPITFRGAGWSWIIKYFFLIMPVLFSIYLLSVVYVLKLVLQKRALFGLVLISLTTPLIAETAQVAQFGRNYFSWLIGMLFCVGYVLHHLKTSLPASPETPWRRLVTNKYIVMLILFIHVLFNARLFFGDVLPTRMATTKVDRWLRQNQVKDIHAQYNHLYVHYAIHVLNNPKLKDKVNIIGIKTILQPQEGYILVPPTTGKSIWSDCAVDDFDRDPFFNELYYSGKLSEYAVASFPTQATSKIWVQEEEVCTYRDLILGQVTTEDRNKSYIHILDAEKLQKEWFPHRD